MKINIKQLLSREEIDYLLVNSTNEYLVEYPLLSENARYTLTNFSGSTGDALVTSDEIFLFVDGRYHVQADREVFDGIKVVKLAQGQNQDEFIRKIINPQKTLGVTAKKVSQKRLEGYSGYKVKLLQKDPINDFTEIHSHNYVQAFPNKNYHTDKAMFISNLEEVSYITGLRDFSRDCSAKIWQKMFIDKDRQILFDNDVACREFLKNYKDEIIVDKSAISAYEYALINKPIHKVSEISKLKSIKTEEELEAYKKSFKRTDNALMSVRNYIEENDNLSEYDIADYLKKSFINQGAKSLSFNSIVAVNQNSSLAHYAKNSKDIILTEGSLVLIDCGMYDESGLATDITRVFVKGKPSELQVRVYTMVLKAFLNSFNSDLDTGYEIDTLAHGILDNTVEGFKFNHGLGHGIGINVHEYPPNLSGNEIAKCKIEDNMTFTIEPGLYNPEHFGIRLENSCFKKDGKIHSLTDMGYERKLIDMSMLSAQEKEWLKGFKIL